MNISRFVKIAAVTLFTLVCVSAVEASPWRSLGPKREIHTLIITGNYKSPRLLADLIQDESRQPYILLPDPRDEVQKIFFCLPKKSMEVQEKYFNDVIRTAGPKRIIILGDERYVPRRFEKMLDGKIPVVRITGESWGRIAEELTFMLNLNHLGRNFRKLQNKMYEEGYRPVSRPAETKQENTEAQQNNVAPAQDVPAEAK